MTISQSKIKIKEICAVCVYIVLIRTYAFTFLCPRYLVTVRLLVHKHELINYECLTKETGK